MKKCEISIETGVPVVQTYPRLMRDILAFTDFDIDQALELYGIALTDEFQALNISNPTLKNITAFIEQDNIDTANKLSKQDRQNLLNISVQPEYYTDLKDRFINAFNVDGEFGINASQLRASGLFTSSDILEMDSEQNLNKLRQLYYKLNNTDEQFESIASKINVKNNLFDKLSPDEFIQNSYDFYIGSETEQDVINKANEIGDDLILENNSLVPLVLEAVKGKQMYVQYEADELSGKIVKKSSNDTLVRLQQTLDLNQDFTGLLDQINFIRSTPIDSYVEDLPLVSQFMANLEAQGASLGVDIKGLAETMEDKSYGEIIEFLDDLYNFLYDVNTSSSESIGESLETYVNSYNNFFNIQPVFKSTVSDSISKKGVYLHLESNISEEDLFKSNSLLKVKDNVYQKISDTNSVEDLYGLLFDNTSLIPNGVLSLKPTEINRDLVYEELDQYVSEKAKQYLTDNSDPEAVKKMVLYKMVNGIMNNNTELTLNGLYSMNVNNFLVDFNKLSLRNSKVQDLFYFSNRGLEANRVIGEYTARDIKNSIPTRDFDNLVLYAKISGNESLNYFTNFNNDISSENMRDYYANNLHQLPVFEGNYYRNNGYVVATTNNDFLNIKNALYEKVAPNVFAEVERDPRYVNYDLKKPSYDNSITPELQGQEATKVKVTKMKNINDDTIEFC